MERKSDANTLRVKTRQNVADEYNINVRTLSRRLKNASIILPPGLIMPKELQMIYNKFGTPKK